MLWSKASNALLKSMNTVNDKFLCIDILQNSVNSVNSNVANSVGCSLRKPYWL